MPRALAGRLVDLSHLLFPGKEEYHLELDTHFTDELYPQYKRDQDIWYILQDMRMSSHCGTHIEFPYHHNRNGLDAGRFPLERLVGDAVLLDFRHKQPRRGGEPRGARSARGAGSRPGDSVLFHFGCARFYRTRALPRPAVHRATRPSAGWCSRRGSTWSAPTPRGSRSRACPTSPTTSS